MKNNIQNIWAFKNFERWSPGSANGTNVERISQLIKSQCKNKINKCC